MKKETTRNSMFDYKVAYNIKEWDDEGTTYTQMITIFIPHINVLKYLINDNIKAYREISGSWYIKTFLKELKEGKNYTNLTTAEYIIVNFLNPNDIRFKRDRNSIINVKIIK